MSETKNVVITGASGGIGAALAIQLGASGHRVAAAPRREAELNEVASRAGAVAIVTDVTRRADVDRLRDRAIDAFGHVDMWVNNAGRGITRPVLELQDDEFDAIMAVNVKSALYGMQAIAPHFVERGRGHIINVATQFQQNALGGTPAVQVGTAPGIQRADEVAAAIVALIAEPKAEIYTNPQHAAIALEYFQDVGAFERENMSR